MSELSPQGTSLAQSVSNLWAWIHTWEDDDGGIHGPVVYHHRDNLKVIRPDTWTQSASLLGLLNLYNSSGDKDFLIAASRLGEFLVSNYIGEIHTFRDSNFDRKPLGQPALEGNAMACLALIELAKALPSGGERFKETAEDNIMEFLVKQWDPRTKSFAMTYHGGSAHIHNKSAMAILAILAKEYYRRGVELVDRYAVPTAEYTLSCQVAAGNYAGAMPYADRDSNYRTLYSLVTALGLLGVYEATGNEAYLSGVVKLMNHLAKFVDRKTGLICHAHRVGYPQWVTDSILYLFVTKKLYEEKQIVIETDFSGLLAKVLAYQYRSGAFPLSLGFEDLWYRDVMKARPEISRWRDILPTPGMNSWNFWFLSALLRTGEEIPHSKIAFPHRLVSAKEEKEGPFEILDGEGEIRIVSLLNGSVAYLASKHDHVPTICRMSERTSYWRTLDSIMRYPAPLRRIILAAPRLGLKLKR